MEITITEKNIHEFLKQTFNNITKIIWRADDINKLIIKNFPNLQVLYYSSNQITTLEPLAHCINLQELYCTNNQITTLEPLAYCINLQELNCWDNQITTLKSLAHCINL